jgi:hypothetical protein
MAATDEEARAAEECWSWVREDASRLGLGGCLTFVRGLSSERVLEAFGMEVERAQLLPLSRADEALPDPPWEVDDRGNVKSPWVRVGRVNDWAFAIESTTLMGVLERVGAKLSRDTEAIVVSWTGPTEGFSYYANESAVTRFDPILADQRGGSDPDRLRAEMRRVGLLEKPPMPPRGLSGAERRRLFSQMELPDSRTQMLAVVTLATGVCVPREMAHGPLLTCQRRPASPG